MDIRFTSAIALQAIVGAMVNQQMTQKPRSYFLEKVGQGLRSNDALAAEDLSAAVNKAVETGVISVEEAQIHFPGWESHLKPETPESESQGAPVVECRIEKNGMR